MGIAQRGLKLNTMAISAYKEAIKLKPDLIEAHLNLGNIYLQMKNMGLALQCFQTAVRLAPNSAKAQSSLQKAQKSQKTARKEASPFGRLVDGSETNQQHRSVEPRGLDVPARTAERELVQEVTKKVRTNAKALVPLLDESLQAQMHRLQKVVLQAENRLSSAEHIEFFSQSLNELEQLKGGIAEALQDIRKHLGEDD
jgi:tetratricopeptide (TPR) repeat protein